MPYIKQLDREILTPVSHAPASTSGELNFQITRLVQSYLGNSLGNYAAFNDAVGALECAKLELYRRMVAPYEDQKIQENGDVY